MTLGCFCVRESTAFHVECESRWEILHAKWRVVSYATPASLKKQLCMPRNGVLKTGHGSRYSYVDVVVGVN